MQSANKMRKLIVQLASSLTTDVDAGPFKPVIVSLAPVFLSVLLQPSYISTETCKFNNIRAKSSD